MALLAVAATSVALSACSSSSPSSTTVPSQPSATTAPTSSPSATAASPATTVAVSSACQAPNVNDAEYGSEGAAGTLEMTLSITNISTAPCTMQGYPAVALLDASGNPMATVETHGGGLAFESVAVADVSLTRGQTAYFNLGFSDVPVGLGDLVSDGIPAPGHLAGVHAKIRGAGCRSRCVRGWCRTRVGGVRGDRLGRHPDDRPPSITADQRRFGPLVGQAGGAL